MNAIYPYDFPFGYLVVCILLILFVWLLLR